MSKQIPLISASSPTRPRSACDLSQRHMFTAHAGMLLPVLSLDLIPHDHVEINAKDFMRTLPMNSAAFMSLRGVYEFFFVPYSQLWHPFDQFITGMKDYSSASISSLYSNQSASSIPTFNLSDLYRDFISGSYNSVDMFGFKKLTGEQRLMDLLGYGRVLKTNAKSISGQNLDVFDFKVVPFRALAYQKIYNDFYMNSTYETRDVSCFNIDDVKGSISDYKRLHSFFELRYRNAQVDYFTNLRPNPLFTDASPSVVGNFFVTDNDGIGVNKEGVHVSLVNSSPSTAVNAGNGSFTVTSLRSAFALDKMLQVSMRAGKTYAEQIAAHYGVKVPVGRDHKVSYLGGFDSDFQVGDVTQMAGTSVSNTVENAQYGGYLGKVTGKSTASGSGRVVYDAKEHGILMCIYSAVPDMQFDCSRIDPFNVKSERGQFFQPEFENLGLQPLDVKFVNYKHGKDSVIGWQPRYSEYKTALDINHGQFMDGEPLSYWTVGRFRAAVKNWHGMTVSQFKIDPGWLNSVFALDYDGTEVTDCLFGGCNFNIQCVRDMSYDGLPRV